MTQVLPDDLGRAPWDPDYGEPPATLMPGEFEFRGLRFGSWSSGYQLKKGGFSESDTEIVTQDQDGDYGDQLRFGRDRLGGKLYTWELNISREGPNKWAEVEAALSQFESIWLETLTRHYPGRLDVLRLRTGSQARRLFGRPRRCSLIREDARRGVGKIVCDFQAVNNKSYDDIVQGHSLGVVPASLGGLLAPLSAPLTSASTGQRAGYITIPGNSLTPIVIQFNGPSTNPRVSVPGYFTVGLNDTLKYDEQVLVETRFGRTSVMKGYASIAGKLTRDSTPLDEVHLPPGTHELIYTATDITGTSSVDVAWYPARSSL
jgi:hypothetical protein